MEEQIQFSSIWDGRIGLPQVKHPPKKSKAKNNTRSMAPDGSDDLSSEDEDAGQQIVFKSSSDSEDGDGTDDGDGTNDWLAPEEDDDLTESLTLDDIENASDEDESDAYTTSGCKETLAKVMAHHTYVRGGRGHATEDKSVVGYIPTTFLKAPAFKNKFHSYNGGFVLTCGNQPEVAVICLVTKFADMDEDTFQKFNQVTTTLRFMEQVRAPVTRNGAKASGLIVLMVHLQASHQRTRYQTALEEPSFGLKLTNKYYSLTDTSPLYRIAIVLHPSFRNEYFKLANWEPEWISEAIRLTRDMWISTYKPKPIEPCASLAVVSKRPKTGMLAGLGGAAAA
ncbi:hypothetical protein PSTG_15949 [Puccinia striiformis f. sp. tritici PST-78]|uniref:Uncharacterized protein n=1 Tax=Puccinia striiformis f. sp. tritici PST-78 TaxID=1165861 RepID=A0A0L0UUM1_9BASI|nr:hypothetical protein PSTG_15949 [Puccinia striiformis f. sp. tritici PST-78]